MNPQALISKHFDYADALMQPQWGHLADFDDGLTNDILNNLYNTFKWMDSIREEFNKPIIVHVAFRTPDYNRLVHGAESSMHLLGRAVDFHVKDMTCDDAKQYILDNNLLEKYNLRMEQNGVGAGWIHLDDKDVPPGGARFFLP